MLIVWPCYISESLQGYHEKRLLNQFFGPGNNYSTMERPVRNESMSHPVVFGLTLQQIMDVGKCFLPTLRYTLTPHLTFAMQPRTPAPIWYFESFIRWKEPDADKHTMDHHGTVYRSAFAPLSTSARSSCLFFYGRYKWFLQRIL